MTARRDGLLSGDALRGYELLVGRGSAPHDALESQEWSGLGELVALGLADRPAPQRAWLPVAPETAIAHLADVRARRLAAFADAVAEQDRRLADLQREAGTAQGAPSRFGTEVLTDTSRIHTLVNELPLRAKEEYLSLDDGQESEYVVYEYPEPVIERRLTLRTIVPLFEEAKPQFDLLVSNAERIGEELRAARTVPLRMLIVDSSEALVASAGRGLDEAIYTRSPELVRALREFFELIWVGARPVTPTAGGQFSRRDRALLGLLAAGASDNEIARKLGTSERTVRRLVAALSEELGAHSRFQLALHAHREGLIPVT